MKGDNPITHPPARNDAYRLAAGGGTYYFLLRRVPFAYGQCSYYPPPSLPPQPLFSQRVSAATRSQLVISLAFEVARYNAEKIFILNRFFVSARDIHYGIPKDPPESAANRPL